MASSLKKLWRQDKIWQTYTMDIVNLGNILLFWCVVLMCTFITIIVDLFGHTIIWGSAQCTKQTLPPSVIDYLQLLWCVTTHVVCHLLDPCYHLNGHGLCPSPSVLFRLCCVFNLPILECFCSLQPIALRDLCFWFIHSQPVQLLPCCVLETLMSLSLLSCPTMFFIYDPHCILPHYRESLDTTYLCVAM